MIFTEVSNARPALVGVRSEKRDFDHVITFPDHCTANKLKHTCQRLCGHSPSHPFLRFEQVAAPVEVHAKSMTKHSKKIVFFLAIIIKTVYSAFVLHEYYSLNDNPKQIFMIKSFSYELPFYHCSLASVRLDTDTRAGR